MICSRFTVGMPMPCPSMPGRSATLPVLMSSSASVTCMLPTGLVVSPSLLWDKKMDLRLPSGMPSAIFSMASSFPFAERRKFFPALGTINQFAHKAKHLGSVAQVVVHQHHRDACLVPDLIGHGAARLVNGPVAQQHIGVLSRYLFGTGRRPRAHPYPQGRKGEVLVGDVPLVGSRGTEVPTNELLGSQAEQVHRADGVRAEHALDLLRHQHAAATHVDDLAHVSPGMAAAAPRKRSHASNARRRTGHQKGELPSGHASSRLHMPHLSPLVSSLMNATPTVAVCP